jgi:hypothetical protein
MGFGNFGGDKNSPKTTQQSSSTTKNTQIGGPVTAGANSTVGGSVVLSDLTNVKGLDITTTDQGAVNAGLQIALKALDSTNSELQTVQGTANSAIDAATSVATTAAQGQQNTSLRYIIYGVVALGAVAAFYAYYSHKG